MLVEFPIPMVQSNPLLGTIVPGSIPRRDPWDCQFGLPPQKDPPLAPPHGSRLGSPGAQIRAGRRSTSRAGRRTSSAALTTKRSPSNAASMALWASLGRGVRRRGVMTSTTQGRVVYRPLKTYIFYPITILDVWCW